MKKHDIARKAANIGLSVVLGACICGPSLAFAAGEQVPAEKNETVYIFTDANGSVKSTEVDTVLKNPDGANKLADYTNLADIESSDDKTHEGTQGAIVWDADGENVSYKGSSSLSAPIGVHVSYSLDGVPVSADEIAGKSGRAVIRYDFENRSEVQATVNGVTQTMYTPFTCVTALMFDGDDFKNISVENGKTISDGDEIIIAGYAMPGLKESLGSMASDADVPDHFTITADVANFELKSTMTIATAGLMADLDIDKLGIGNVDDASALYDAMGELISGSVKLSEGLDTLSGHLKELETGTTGIQSGAETLSGGLAVLAGDSGLGYLNGSANALAGSIGLIGEAVTGLKAELLSVSTSLKEACGASGQFEGAIATMEANKAAIVKEGGMSEADYGAVVQALASAQIMAGTVQAIASGIDANASKIDELAAKVEQVRMGASEIAGGIYTASQSAYALAEGAQELEAYASQLSQAVPPLAEGAQVAADGSRRLTQGMQTFNDQGIAQLVNTLQSDYGGMLDRMNALSDAAKSYTNFGGITDGTAGSVKFVFEIDAIKKQ